MNTHLENGILIIAMLALALRTDDHERSGNVEFEPFTYSDVLVRIYALDFLVRYVTNKFLTPLRCYHTTELLLYLGIKFMFSVGCIKVMDYDL